MPRLICAAVVLACTAAVADGQTAPAVPASRPAPPVVDAQTYLSLEDLQKNFDNKLYDFVIAQIGKIQLNKKIYEANYDAGDLLKLKAEAYLQSNRSRALTIETFNLAARAFTKDDKKAAACQTMAILAEKNPNGKYARKTVDGKPAPAGVQAPPPLPLNDYARRTELFTALFEDEYLNVQPAMKAALPATSLKPIADAAVIVGNARTFELAATQDDAKTSGPCTQLAQRAADLIDLAMERNANQITLINQTANVLVTYQETAYDALAGRAVARNRQRRAGLTPKDTATLSAIVAEADQSTAAISEFSTKLRAGSVMQKTALNAAKISQAAKSVLTADYSAIR